MRMRLWQTFYVGSAISLAVFVALATPQSQAQRAVSHSATAAPSHSFSAPVRVSAPPRSAPSAPRTSNPIPAPRYGAPVGVGSGSFHPAPPVSTYAGQRGTLPPGYARTWSNTGTASTRFSTSNARSASPNRRHEYGSSSARSSGWSGNRHRDGVRLYAYAGQISPIGWWLGPYQFYPWLDADLSYDYWHDTGDTDTAVAMASTGADMVQDAPLPPYPNGDAADDNEPDPNAPAGWQATQLDTGAPALTLIYKDGRSEQVANYVVSRTAVTVIDDGGVRSVAVGDLDVNAMATANAKSGLALPQGLR